MNEYDILKCGWQSPYSDQEHSWLDVERLGGIDNVFNSTVWEAWDYLAFKLRNGQIIRVKKKEGK